MRCRPVLGKKTSSVLAGPEQNEHNAHDAVFTHHSEYFCNALRGPWKEADEGIIVLENVEVETCE